MSIFGAKSDSYYSMIDSGSARGCVDDSTGVILPSSTASCNKDWSWTSLDRSQECIGVLRQNLLISKRGHEFIGQSELFLSGIAHPYCTRISPVRFLYTSMLRVVGECRLRPVALTICVTRDWWSTVNKLLLRKFDQGARLYVVSTFHARYGVECPAGAAHALVLDWSHSALCDPVEGGVERRSCFWCPLSSSW